MLPLREFNEDIFSSSFWEYLIVPKTSNSDILFFKSGLFSFFRAFFKGIKYFELNFLVSVSKLLDLTLGSSFNSWKPIRALDIFDLTPLFGLITFISFFLKKPRLVLFENCNSS